MEKGRRKEDVGIKMKEKKIDDKVKVVDYNKSEKKNEMKLMKEKLEDRAKGKVEIQMQGTTGHKVKDDHAGNRMPEKTGINLTARNSSTIMEKTEKGEITFFKQNLDDKLKNRFEIKMKEEVSNLAEEVGNKIKDQLGMRMKEEIMNKMQRVMETKAKGVDTSTTEKIGKKAGIEEKVKGATPKKDDKIHKIEEHGMKWNGDVQNKMTREDLKKNIVHNEKKKENEHNLKENSSSTMRKDVGIHKKEDGGNKLKGDIQEKTTRDVNKGIFENLKEQQLGVQMTKVNQQNLKESISGTMRQEDDRCYRKGGIQNKTITRDVNKEIVNNVKLQSRVEKKETSHDLNQNVRSLIQKDGHKMKGEVENKRLTRDVNNEIVDNVKVQQSGLEKKNENEHDLKEKVGSAMQQEDVGSHKKKDDGINMNREIDDDNMMKVRDMNEEMVHNAKEPSDLGKKKETGFVLKEKVRSIMQKDIGTHRNKRTTSIDNAKKPSGLEKEKESGRRHYVETNTKKQNESKGVVHDESKEKFAIQNELQEKSRSRMKETIGLNKPSSVDERTKITGGIDNTISKHIETKGSRGKDEIKNGTKEKVGDKVKAKHVMAKDEKNGIKMKEDVGNKTKESVGHMKKKEVGHIARENVGMKIKGEVENAMKEKEAGNKAKAKAGHDIRKEVDLKSKKGEKVGIKTKGQAKIKKAGEHETKLEKE